MDDKEEKPSLGAYENMEKAETRPDFIADILGNSDAGDYNADDEESELESGESDSDSRSNAAKNILRTGEDSAQNNSSNSFLPKRTKVEQDEAGFSGQNSSTQSIAENSDNNIAEKATTAKTGTDTNNAATKTAKNAEKTGAKQGANASGMANKAKALSKMGKGKLAIAGGGPTAILIICLLLIVVVIASLGGSALFFAAYSSNAKKVDDTATLVNHETTDYQLNNTQLGNNNGESEYGETIYENMGLSDYQIQSFEKAGLMYEESDDGTKALVYTEPNGTKTYIGADSTLSGKKYYGDEVIGENNDEYIDSGASDGKTDEERMQDFTIALNVPEGSRIIKYSDISKHFGIKMAFTAATEAYRGGMGAWYNDAAKQTAKRLGISLNVFKKYQDSNDEQANEKYVIETAAHATARSGSGVGVGVGVGSLESIAEKVAQESASEGCGYDSAATAVAAVANADETYKQTVAGAFFMESIDKNLAGSSGSSPSNAILSMAYKSGALTAEGMRHLFSNSNSKFNQSSNDVLSTSAQANLGVNGTVDTKALSEDGQKESETCIYVSNVNEHENKGATSLIGSMFTKVTSWIKSKLSNIGSFIISFFQDTTEDFTSSVRAALSPAIGKFKQMMGKSGYLTGNDNVTLGEAFMSSTELISNEMAKSVTATMAGDIGAVETAERIRDEVIAERAEYDRMTKSPFDPTSEYTFLGKIAYSLIPFATSTSSVSLTSTVSKFGTAVSDAAISLLPISSALSHSRIENNLGDCVFGNSLAAISNGHCNNYQSFEPKTITQNPTDIFNKVASRRIDEGGYIFGINKMDVASSNYQIDYNRFSGYNDKTSADESGRDTTDPDYGKGPLNPDESNYESHWGKGKREGEEGDGTPHGCESDWQYEVRSYKDDNGKTHKYRYYHFDQPSEWKYTRMTNFEYEGYKTGYPNLVAKGSVGREEAKNEDNPGECVLDLKTDEQKQPIINIKGMLGMFILMNGQRTSQFGVADQGNVDILATTDYIHGRLHPCDVSVAKELYICKTFLEKDNGWEADPKVIATDSFLSRLVSGSAFVNFTNTVLDTVRRGFTNDDIFRDKDGSFFRDEMTEYSAFLSLNEWMEANDLLKQSSTALALEKYYKENPLDNSYAGIIARYSGQKKDTVVAVLQLMDYVEWLANYDPTDLYPLGPNEKEVIIYDGAEIVATLEPIINNMGVVYDELRNRTTTC